MTIKQKAEELGVSPQAVYQRLKRNNVDVSSLTDKETKELTGEGEIIISKLFSSETQPIKTIKHDQTRKRRVG